MHGLNEWQKLDGKVVNDSHTHTADINHMNTDTPHNSSTQLNPAELECIALDLGISLKDSDISDEMKKRFPTVFRSE